MSKTNTAQMWIATVIIIVGFVLAFRNLNGKVFKSKYEGLSLAIAGLAYAVFTGVRSKESFTSLLYGF